MSNHRAQWWWRRRGVVTKRKVTWRQGWTSCGDLDLDRGTATVRGSYHLREMNDTKTEKSKRTLERFPRTVSLLRQILPDDPDPNAPVFNTLHSGRTDPKHSPTSGTKHLRRSASGSGGSTRRRTSSARPRSCAASPSRGWRINAASRTRRSAVITAGTPRADYWMCRFPR